MEAIEVARLAGLEPDDWQQFVTINSLGERADGKWAAQTVGLTVARQNGKDSCLEIRELVGLFVLGERLILHTAHQQKTATSHFLRLLSLIEAVPEFDQRVMKAPKGKGNEAIELRGGQKIFFATRAGGGGRGLTGDLLIYNEAMYLSEQDRSSLAPTMAARSIHGNIQTWYVGSAPDEEDPAQDGVPFAQVRASGIKRAPGVAYFEWSAPGDDPSNVPIELASDPAIWAMANPGLGHRISHEWVGHERTVEMSARGFAVERLSIGAWPAVDGSAARKISKDAWDACEDLASTCDDPVAVAFDVTPSQSAAAIGVAGWRADRHAHLEVAAAKPGTGWVVDALVRLVSSQDAAAILYDKRSPAAALIPDLAEALTAAGLDIELAGIDSSEMARACGLLFDAVGQAKAHHRGMPDLASAVAGAATRALGDAWAWARKTSTADISPLVAVTLALWGLRTIEPSSSEPLVAFV